MTTNTEKEKKGDNERNEKRIKKERRKITR